MHSFLKEQPDLNWRTKRLRTALFGEIRFWLEQGVDAFRLDVVNMLSKDEKLRDNPRSLNLPHFQEFRYNLNRGKSYRIVRKLRKLVESCGDRVIVGEVFALPPGDSKAAASYLGDGSDGAHLVFDFSLIFRRWNARAYAETIRSGYSHLPSKSWPCHVMSNHDLQRSINRLGPGAHRRARAKLQAVLLLTLRSTPFLYHGEDIGMQKVRIDRKHLADAVSKRYWPLFNRDRSRTPMQWSAEPNAGFSTVRPWLPVGKDYEAVNVRSQHQDPDSLLSFYKSLIRIRRRRPFLQRGDWQPLRGCKSGVLSYLRRYAEEVTLVVLNFTGRSRPFVLPGETSWRVVFSTDRAAGTHVESGDLKVSGFEASLFENA